MSQMWKVCSKFLSSAIAKRSKEHRKLVQTVEKLTSTIKSKLTSLDFYILKRTLSHNVCKAANRVIKAHQKKLDNLTRNAVLPFTSNETVTNISSHNLTPEQLNILKFGQTYSIRPPKINTSDVHTCFELIHQIMAKNLKDTKLEGKLAADLSHLSLSTTTVPMPLSLLSTVRKPSLAS